MNYYTFAYNNDNIMMKQERWIYDISPLSEQNAGDSIPPFIIYIEENEVYEKYPHETNLKVHKMENENVNIFNNENTTTFKKSNDKKETFIWKLIFNGVSQITANW